MQTPNHHHNQSSQLLLQQQHHQQQQQQLHPQQQQQLQHHHQQQQQLQQQQFYQQQHQHQYQQFQNFQQYQLYQQYHQQPLLQQQQQPTKQAHHLNKIICSLKSDLPNEIDFAIQVATLLANSDNFKWSKDHPLIDAICSSLHVFVCVCENSSNCYCYTRFWRKLLTKHLKNPFLQQAAAPPDIEQSFLKFSSIECHQSKEHLKIYKRIKTAAELIKQFSMTISKNEKEEPQATVDNQQNINYYQETTTTAKKKKPKASPSLVKFVALLLYCDDVTLNFIGLDILSNAASKMAKVQDETCSHLFQMFEEYCVDSVSSQDGDIYVIVRSLEMISRLISSPNRRVTANIMNLIVERDLISRLEQFLTSHHDVTLFLAALECCYRVSRHQPHLLVTSRAKYLLKILVILLNCDISTYFTQSALMKVRLIEPMAQSPPPPTTPLRILKQVAPAKTTTIITTTTTTTTTTTATTTTDGEPSVEPPPTKTTSTQEAPQPKETQAPVKEFTCEWNNCNSKFLEAKQVHTHVFETHIEPLEADTISPCLWSGPNGSGPGCITKRPKFSLLTHLNDFHCNQVALEHGQSIKPPEHPGYAPNAALLAIRRHANAHPEGLNGSKSIHPTQAPLITSVRLTAALILRNLATESPEMKQALENHEPLLSEICMTNGRDESKIIAECLSLFCSEG